MKTAVSIPDELFRKAEKEARRRKISRSALITRALSSYLEPQDSELTRRINEFCRENDTRMDPGLAAMQARALRSDNEW